jgi:hypothetical protein
MDVLDLELGFLAPLAVVAPAATAATPAAAATAPAAVSWRLTASAIGWLAWRRPWSIEATRLTRSPHEPTRTPTTARTTAAAVTTSTSRSRIGTAQGSFGSRRR